MLNRGDLLNRQPQLASLSVGFSHPPPLLPFPLDHGWSIYSSVFLLQYHPFIFTDPLSSSALYSLHVCVSFTGKSLQLSACQYFSCGECCPLFLVIYHLYIFIKQLIYLTLAFFSPSSYSIPSLPSPLPELVTSRLRFKRNGRSGREREREEGIVEAQNGACMSKFDISTGTKMNKSPHNRRKRRVRRINAERN